MNIAIKAENISKAYQLGEFSTGTISKDIERWWALLRGKEDPFLKIGETNNRSIKGKSDIVWSLKDINFEINQGDAVGIIGRNGAGKSTLLKVLSRVTTPTTGNIKVKGRIASLLEVGTGFHPELTGKENIYLNGAILGMRKHEISRKFDEIVDFSGVERYIDTPVKRYSSGMYVRLAFAVAAYLESEILVVDEVLAVGDAEFQKKCLGKMGDVSSKEGRTVLFVSHNMAAIKTFCRTGIMLEYGQVKEQGEISSVVGKYTNLNENYLSKNIIQIKETGVNDINFLDQNLNIISDLEDFDYCWLKFEFNNINTLIPNSLGFTIYNFNNEPIISAITDDCQIEFKETNFSISCKIPCSYFVPGMYYVEYAFNGKNVENAISIEKTMTNSKFLSKGHKSKSNLVIVDWIQN